MSTQLKREKMNLVVFLNAIIGSIYHTIHSTFYEGYVGVPQNDVGGLGIYVIFQQNRALLSQKCRDDTYSVEGIKMAPVEPILKLDMEAVSAVHSL
jgi:hypothetical protein